MTFFIATIGRSGSTWLSDTLNRGDHEVVHEEADTHPQPYVRAFQRFPIERFAKSNYGEVHGYLRYHLSPLAIGPEILIQKRAILQRDPRKVIASWMNRDNRSIEELSAVCFEVLYQRRILNEWASATDSRILELEEITSSVSELQEVLNWLGIIYTATESDLEPKNANANGKRDIWFTWDDNAESVMQTSAFRQGMKV